MQAIILAAGMGKRLKEYTILLESDIFFEPAVLDALLEDPRDTLALVDRYESWMDGTCLKLREDDSIDAFIPGKSLNFREKELYYTRFISQSFDFCVDYFLCFRRFLFGMGRSTVLCEQSCCQSDNGEDYLCNGTHWIG